MNQWFDDYEIELFSLFNRYPGIDAFNDYMNFDEDSLKKWLALSDTKRAELLVESMMSVFFHEGATAGGFKLKRIRQDLMKKVETDGARELVQFCYETLYSEWVMTGEL